MSFSSLLSHCYGAIVIRNDSSPSVAAMSTAVNDDLVKRLSFPWLSLGPIPRKRLALVGAGSILKLNGFLVAAYSLNIALVVFDDASHWMSNAASSYFREEFVPLDMTVSADIAQRIALAVTEYQSTNTEEKHLNGIISAEEHLHTIISHAATKLGFNTSPPESVGLAQNKFETRQLDTNIFCRLVSSLADLEKMLSDDGPELLYPLIVKPSKGWSSEESGKWLTRRSYVKRFFRYGASLSPLGTATTLSSRHISMGPKLTPTWSLLMARLSSSRLVTTSLALEIARATKAVLGWPTLSRRRTCCHQLFLHPSSSRCRKDCMSLPWLQASEPLCCISRPSYATRAATMLRIPTGIDLSTCSSRNRQPQQHSKRMSSSLRSTAAHQAGK
jgi:hypothetical protein